jgi:hypothetical protein
MGFTQGEAAHASQMCRAAYQRTIRALVDERKILPIPFPYFRLGALSLATPRKRVSRAH